MAISLRSACQSVNVSLYIPIKKKTLLLFWVCSFACTLLGFKSEVMPFYKAPSFSFNLWDFLLLQDVEWCFQVVVLLVSAPHTFIPSLWLPKEAVSALFQLPLTGNEVGQSTTAKYKLAAQVSSDWETLLNTNIISDELI